MKVSLIFDREFGVREAADLGPAFWLIESLPNRRLAEQAWATGAADANSAVFKSGDQVTEVDVRARVEDIDLHHPSWTEIVVQSFLLSSSLCSCFAALGFDVTGTTAGFVVKRKI